MIQDSTQLQHVVIPRHVVSDKEQFVIHKTMLAVPINVKLLDLEQSVEQVGTRLAISKKRVMDPVRIVLLIKLRMMGRIVEMIYNVRVVFVRV